MTDLSATDVRSGYIDLFVVTGLPATFGSHGYGLPSVAVDYIDDIFKATGIFLRFSASGVNPSYYGTRWYGLPRPLFGNTNYEKRPILSLTVIIVLSYTLIRSFCKLPY